MESGLVLFPGVITDIYYLFGVSHRARIYDLKRSRQYLLLAAASIFLLEGHTGSNLSKTISQCGIISAASVCLKLAFLCRDCFPVSVLEVVHFLIQC